MILLLAKLSVMTIDFDFCKKKKEKEKPRILTVGIWCETDAGW